MLILQISALRFIQIFTHLWHVFGDFDVGSPINKNLLFKNAPQGSWIFSLQNQLMISINSNKIEKITSQVFQLLKILFNNSFFISNITSYYYRFNIQHISIWNSILSSYLHIWKKILYFMVLKTGKIIHFF